MKQRRQSRTDIQNPPLMKSQSTDSNALFQLARKASKGLTIPFGKRSSSLDSFQDIDYSPVDDTYNYALLIALYTLQGIPMGLSASIPFLIQQKVKMIVENTVVTGTAAVAGAGGAESVVPAAVDMASSSLHSHADIAKMAYNAQAIFALCSWPFSLKLLWAPLVDSVFWSRFGRRKSWLVPVQLLAGLIMVLGSDYVEKQLGLSDVLMMSSGSSSSSSSSLGTFDVKGVTAFFFVLYFLMATQDIAVDGWALTMLSRKNRGRGPVCNSIGQNLGYFLAFVGFLALNDPDSSETLWRPLLGLKSNPDKGLVSLGGFIRFMGFVMIALTTFVAIFKKEDGTRSNSSNKSATSALQTSDNGKGKGKDRSRIGAMKKVLQTKQSTMAIQDFNNDDDDDDEAELDASEIGLQETYHRLWAVCKLPAVRWLFVILLTNRFPTALSDKVKFLKAVEFGMSKQTTALLAPTIILPLGITVPIVAAKLFKGHPLRQFLTAYKLRVTLVPLLDVLMLLAIRSHHHHLNHPNNLLHSNLIFWSTVIASTALFSIVDSLQFNAQMVFFAHRVDPAIGGTYMTLLNTAANLGSTWPASVVMYMMGQLSSSPQCIVEESTGVETCSGGVEAYFPLQMILSILGCAWVYFMGKKVQQLASLPDDAWRTHLDEEENDDHGKRKGRTGGGMDVEETYGREEKKEK